MLFPKDAPGRRRLAVLSLLLVLAAGILAFRESRYLTVYALRLPSGPVVLMEDPRHPGLQRFREAEGIAEIAGEHRSEARRLQALAEWTSRLFACGIPFPNYPPWDAAAILEMIRRGETGGFCAQYAVVFGQAAQSLGFPVRYVDLISSTKDVSHFVPEVYLREPATWAVFDPQAGISYTDGGGTPLGVFELSEYQSGLRSGKVLVVPGKESLSKEGLNLFRYFRYFLRNNFLSLPVYHKVRSVDAGSQWLFEPYTLSWGGHDAGDAGPWPRWSRDPADFTYPVDFDSALRVTCRSGRKLQDLLERAEPHALYRIRLPGNVLRTLVERVLIDDASYIPLTRE